MTKSTVADWDTTAANNTDVGGVSIAEDCEMANLNNAIREVMAQTVEWAGTAPRVQVFTSSGTYTPHANMLYCQIQCLGGGGGGGASYPNGFAGEFYGGNGGGGGSFSIKFASRADIGASQTVTIGAAGAGGAAGNNAGGAGGDTSVGTLCIGKGGSGGGVMGHGIVSTGGAGGVSGSGDIVAPGMSGGLGSYGTAVGGKGADSRWGGGGVGQNGVGTNGAGAAATGYGAGGGGGFSGNATPANSAGGNGSPGRVVIIEFCSQ